jgi:hypothetical protein
LKTDASDLSALGAARVANTPTLPDNGMCCHSHEAQIPPDLSHVVNRWKDLPEHIKAAVMALVKTAEVQP